MKESTSQHRGKFFARGWAWYWVCACAIVVGEMAIPNYQELMLPVLRVLGESDGGVLWNKGMVADQIAARLQLSDEERFEELKSGVRLLEDRCAWALWYMQQAGLVEKPERGRWAMAEEGRAVLGRNVPSIDNEFLSQYASFREKVKRTRWKQDAGDASTSGEMARVDAEEEKTPEDLLELAMGRLEQTLIADLREQMAKMDPYRFEKLVVELLLAMGYGGFREDAGQVTKKSNDGGIDGLIKQDRLGLDVVYVQAKRYQEAIGRPDIQNFVGALAGQNASKGIFITTSTFRANAYEYARNLSQKVILIGGEELAALMIEHNIGVSTVRTMEMKRVDTDYFE